jgi:ABC-2 type transport system permease protein
MMMSKVNNFFKRTFNKRSLKYGSNSIILIVAVIAIAIIVNLLVNIKPMKLDLTSNKLYTIGDTTKEILKKLDKDVTIYGLFDYSKVNTDANLKNVVELLQKYNGYSSHLKIEYKDPDKNTDLISKLDPNGVKNLQSGNFVVMSDKRIKKLTDSDLYETQLDQYGNSQTTGLNAEQALTGAIKYVTLNKVPTVYFTDGHGEAKLDTSFKNLKSYLDYNGFIDKTVSLITNNVPADADFLISLAPRKDLTLDEGLKVKEYLKKGGKAMFLMDPIVPDQKLPVFNDVLKDYNISLNNDKIIENDGSLHVPNDNSALYYPLEDNSINTALSSQSLKIILPTARSINILKNQKDNLTVTSLIKSSASAVGKQIIDNKEIKGPLDVAVAAEYNNGNVNTKVIVIGNSAFLSDSMLSQYQYGFYFFANSLNWMQNKKDDVTIQPKTYDTNPLNLSSTVVKTLGLSLLIVLPLIILIIGIIVWNRRRHL